MNRKGSIIRRANIFRWAAFVWRCAEWKRRSDNAFRDHESGCEKQSLWWNAATRLVGSNDTAIWRIWEHHLVAKDSRKELDAFLAISRGKRAFLDIGASAGMFSALFWVTRPKQQCAILSVEPDRKSFQALLETVKYNRPLGSGTWTTMEAVVTDFDGNVGFQPSEFGGVPLQTGAVNPHTRVKAMKIENLCTEWGVVPEVVKIDCESWEWEILNGGLGYLKKMRCALHVEVHMDLLRARGKDASLLLKNIHNAGFRYGNGSVIDIEKTVRGSVARLSLIPGKE